MLETAHADIAEVWVERRVEVHLTATGSSVERDGYLLPKNPCFPRPFRCKRRWPCETYFVLIDEEYDRLVEHLHDCAKKAESFKTTKRRLSLETLELIRQRRAAQATGNQELTSELARLCREAIKEDLKEKRAEVLAEAAEEGKKHPLCPSRLRQPQEEDDCSPEPKGNSHCIEKGDGENHLRLQL
ncbi:hypothetical protein RB195_022969 [Necator americanus]|uniref:CXXC-type zinc finger protein 1 n=1 Tax=Necator americanus TaxID=51031 RepID=A0ABR1EHI8_NECAM